MLAGINGRNGNLIVHVQRRSNYNGIHVFALEQLSIVRKLYGLATGQTHAFAQVRFEDVTHCGDLRVRHGRETPDETAPLAARSDYGNIDSVERAPRGRRPT
jgi:hypothetical protein